MARSWIIETYLIIFFFIKCFCSNYMKCLLDSYERQIENLYWNTHWIQYLCQVSLDILWKAKLRPILDAVLLRLKFIGTNLDLCEANWILELDSTLHLGSSNHEFSFFVFFGLNQFIFPPKWCHLNWPLICHFLVFNLHLKFMGPFYGYQPIGLFYFVGP
jgi:hypothetical protein